MSSGLSIVIDGDEAKAFQAFQKLVDQQTDHQKALGDTGAAARKAKDEGIKAARSEERERNKQIRTAERLVKKHRTLEQTYQSEVATLKKAHQAGKISTQDLEQTVDSLTETYEEQSRAQNETYGQKAQKQVIAFASRFGTVGAAIGLGTKALAAFNEEKDKALNTANELKDQRRNLRQISSDFEADEQTAIRLASANGLTGTAAFDLLFKGISEGFRDDVGLIARANPILDTGTGAEVVAGLKKFFPSEGLSAENSLDSILTASLKSAFNAKDLLEQARVAAQGAGILGASSSDTLAVTAAAAGTLQGSTGTDIRQLAVKLGTDSEQRFEGLDLIESIERLANNETLRKSFVGSDSGLAKTISVLSGKLAEIKTIDRDIESAQTDSNRVLQDRLTKAFDPNTQAGKRESALLELARSRTQNEFANEALLVVSGAQGEIAVNNATSEARRRGFGPVGRFSAQFTAEQLNAFGVPSEISERVGIQMADPSALGTLREMGRLLNINQKQAATLDQLNIQAQRTRSDTALAGKPDEDR